MRAMKNSGVECIGKIPYGKNVLRNKYLLEYVKGKLPQSTNLNKEGLPYIGATYLDTDKDEEIYTTDINLPDAIKEDLLVLWDGARAGLAGRNKEGKISSTIVRIRGNEKTIYQPFLYWYYKGFEEYMYQCVGGTTIPHMNRKYIEDIGFIDWTISEQIKLTSYLDSKCSKIDTIIEKQQAVIEKLKEYKLSVLNEIIANTRGIRCYLNNIGTLKNGLNFMSDGDTTAIKFLGVGDFKDYYILDRKEMFSDITINEIVTDDYLLRDGDMIFVRSNGSKDIVGKCVMVKNIDYPLTYSGFCIRFRNSREDIALNDYLLLIFRSPFFREQMERYSRGSNINNLNQAILSEVPICLPSIIEQKNIVSNLDVKFKIIDDVMQRRQYIIDKLTEYKKSLIYEVVTGKKEV